MVQVSGSLSWGRALLHRAGDRSEVHCPTGTFDFHVSQVALGKTGLLRNAALQAWELSAPKLASCLPKCQGQRIHFCSVLFLCTNSMWEGS